MYLGQWFNSTHLKKEFVNPMKSSKNEMIIEIISCASGIEKENSGQICFAQSTLQKQ